MAAVRKSVLKEVMATRSVSRRIYLVGFGPLRPPSAGLEDMPHGARFWGYYRPYLLRMSIRQKILKPASSKCLSKENTRLIRFLDISTKEIQSV